MKKRTELWDHDFTRGSLIKNSKMHTIADAAGEQITHQKILSNKEATTPRVKQIKYVWEGLPRIQNISIFSSYRCVLVHKTYISFSAFQPLIPYLTLTPQKNYDFIEQK